MKDKFAELGKAYLGPNKAHLQFKQKLTNERVFVYLFMKNREELFTSFQAQIESIRKMAGDKFSLGIVTKGISKTSFKAIIIRANESNLIAKNFDEFQSQVYGKVFAEVHRIFVDYTIDVYNEIIQRHPDLPRCDSLSYKRPRVEAFNRLGLCLMPSGTTGGNTVQELEYRLNLLETTRHVIEHNNSFVDQTYLERNPTSRLKLGGKVDVEPEQIGEAMALVEVLAEDLNKRAIDKFSIS